MHSEENDIVLAIYLREMGQALANSSIKNSSIN
jgi:hypothetical protein